MPAGRASRVRRLTGGIDPRFAAIAIAAGLLFAVLAVLVAVHPAPLAFDRPVELDVQSLKFSPLIPFNAFVSALAGFVGVGVGAAIILVTFIFRRAATPFVAFSAVYSVIYNLVNLIIRRPRPTGVPHTTHDLLGYSFPSGHVGFFVWLGVLALVLLARGLPRTLYVASCAVVAVVVVASAISRMYVGAHWPSDVIGGFLVGVCWTSLSLSIGRLTGPVFFAPGAAAHRHAGGFGWPRRRATKN